jgi:hypothetical protein
MPSQGTSIPSFMTVFLKGVFQMILYEKKKWVQSHGSRQQLRGSLA